MTRILIKSVCLYVLVHLQALFGCMFVVSVLSSCFVQVTHDASVCFSVPFHLCLPSDKYTGPCNWETRGVVRVKGREKYGGVEGYGCFSLGDRACCHGAGPPIGGSLVQSLNSTDCFIIEKFFLSSSLTSHPLLLHLSLFPLLSLFLSLSLLPPFHSKRS